MKNEDLGISRGTIRQENLVPGLADDNGLLLTDTDGATGQNLKDQAEPTQPVTQTDRAPKKASQAFLGRNYNDLGGTGHGDISFSDADPGL
jgi:hypothetical protein